MSRAKRSAPRATPVRRRRHRTCRRRHASRRRCDRCLDCARRGLRSMRSGRACRSDSKRGAFGPPLRRPPILRNRKTTPRPPSARLRSGAPSSTDAFRNGAIVSRDRALGGFRGRAGVPLRPDRPPSSSHRCAETPRTFEKYHGCATRLRLTRDRVIGESALLPGRGPSRRVPAPRGTSSKRGSSRSPGRRVGSWSAGEPMPRVFRHRDRSEMGRSRRAYRPAPTTRRAFAPRSWRPPR